MTGPTIVEDRLLVWADDADEATLEQARKTAALPIVHDHVALMPDAHLGYGCAIGSVVPTEGAIVPSAVGVDLGCFRGDTKVPLLNGTKMSFEDMAADPEATYWVYSYDLESEQIVPGLAKALKTREDAPLVKVTVSGGDEIICTPDHQFLMKDGTYREASQLNFNDSLMPLYRRWETRDGYEAVSDGSHGFKPTHVRIYEALDGPVESGCVVHHVNHNHFDNSPDNLLKMTARAHSAHHRKHGHSFNNHDPEFQKKRIAGIHRRVRDPEGYEAMAKVGTKNITKYMTERPEHFKAAVVGNGKRGAKYLAQWNTTPKDCDCCGETLPNPTALRWHKKREHPGPVSHNHKVVSVEPLNETADVYCLQVEDYHNFALDAGVFVHNCGVDGMLTNLTSADLPDSLGRLLSRIEKTVPAGVGEGHASAAGEWLKANRPRTELDAKQQKTARNQLGTLGSGNHFIEISLDERDRVWIVLHSGSRGIGNQLARGHIDLAKTLERHVDGVLVDPDLRWFVEGTPQFDHYVADMLWAQAYAFENRRLMTNTVFDELQSIIPAAKPVEHYQNHHNYCVLETHGGRDVWVTRKGAISAKPGEYGIIPGSMGASTFVVKGLGSEMSFQSASHGAGRAMSRNKARKTLTLESFEAAMGDRHWLQRKAGNLLDEHPAAYKDIGHVMSLQTDLVTVEHELHSILNFKGAK